MKKARVGSETAIKAAIIACLGLFSTVKVWKNNVGVKGKIHYGLGKGTSDIIGMVTGGRFFALEVKKPGERPTAEQEDFMAEVQRMGGFACVVTSTTEAIAALGRALRGSND